MQREGDWFTLVLRFTWETTGRKPLGRIAETSKADKTVVVRSALPWLKCPLLMDVLLQSRFFSNTCHHFSCMQATLSTACFSLLLCFNLLSIDHLYLQVNLASTIFHNCFSLLTSFCLLYMQHQTLVLGLGLFSVLRFVPWTMGPNFGWFWCYHDRSNLITVTLHCKSLIQNWCAVFVSISC